MYCNNLTYYQNPDKTAIERMDSDRYLQLGGGGGELGLSLGQGLGSGVSKLFSGQVWAKCSGHAPYDLFTPQLLRAAQPRLS